MSKGVINANKEMTSHMIPQFLSPSSGQKLFKSKPADNPLIIKLSGKGLPATAKNMPSLPCGATLKVYSINLGAWIHSPIEAIITNKQT